MSKQTAVEWLVNALELNELIEKENLTVISEFIEQAKAIEKEQINEAFSDGFHCGYEGIEDTEDYYSENYGNKHESTK
jgi:hypothetical protein